MVCPENRRGLLGWMKDTRKAWRVEVHWDDSTIPHRGWQDVNETLSSRERRSTRCTSVGFLLADDDRGVVLAGSVHGGEAAGVVMIPRGAIVDVIRLKPRTT